MLRNQWTTCSGFCTELQQESAHKEIKRFISTHPDDDHINGLDYLDDEMPILNFYCVKNEATKSDDTEAFKRYCELRDSDKAFFFFKDCKRNWMNQSTDERGSAGINILWPIADNNHFEDALEKAKKGESPNNISPIITYSLKDGAEIIWMGDLETDFMKSIEDEIELPRVDILFAPHHGRDSGKVPSKWLEQLDPQIIIIGEAPSENLNYYQGYNTITQNSAGDIIFDCVGDQTHIYVSSETYSVSFLNDKKKNKFDNYIGSLQCG